MQDKSSGDLAPAELTQLQKKVEEQQDKIDSQKVLLEKSYQRTHTAKKKLARVPVKNLQDQLHVTKKNLRRAAATQATVYRIHSTYKNLHSVACREVKHLKAQLTTLQQKLTKAENELAELKSVHRSCHSERVIHTLEGRPPRYTNAIRQCCMDLLSHNVGVQHVSPVIKSVVETLTDYKLDRLPSTAKMSDMLAESKQIALTQIGEQLLSEDNLTMHRDGTTKSGTKYYGAQTSSQTGVVNIGLSAVKSGSAQDSFDCVIDMLQDIELACRNAGSDEPVLQKIMANVKKHHE